MINCRQKHFKGKGISKGGKLMNKLKDLVYDYNDLFVALVIVVIAGVLIFWRISCIADIRSIWPRPTRVSQEAGFRGSGPDAPQVKT